MSVPKLPYCLGRASCERRRFFRDRVRNVWSRSREAGFAGLAALVDPSEGAHGGNRVSHVLGGYAVAVPAMSGRTNGGTLFNAVCSTLMTSKPSALIESSVRRLQSQ